MRKIAVIICAISVLALFGIARGETILDGDLIKTADSFDIYIVKIKASKKFKRLILNPAILNSYGHLKWENVKTVSKTTLDEYALSEFVIQVNPDGSVRDPKVYRVSSAADSDIGERRWLNITSAEFEALGYDWDSIYLINSTEASPDFYPTRQPLTYEILSPVVVQSTPQPASSPAADTSAPDMSGISAVKILADSAVITWSTNEAADSLVKYGISESALSSSATSTPSQVSPPSFKHSVKLSGLNPAAKYYYQAISKDPAGNVSQVITNFFSTTDCYGDVPAMHKTIQEAIGVITKSGGKICVGSGTFSENIIIDGKDVKIAGQGPGKTILTSTNTMTIKNISSATELTGLTIKNSTSSYAILIEDASPVIKNNHLIDSFAGIRVLGNSRPEITYNVFANNSGGITIAHNGNFGDYSIDHNTFVNNGKNGSAATVRLDAPFSSSPIVINNNIFLNGYTGVYEVTASNFYLWNNLFYGNSNIMLQRESAFYYSISAINDLGVATKNISSDPLLDSSYKPAANSTVIGAGTAQSNIGAY